MHDLQKVAFELIKIVGPHGLPHQSVTALYLMGHLHANHPRVKESVIELLGIKAIWKIRGTKRYREQLEDYLRQTMLAGN